MSAILCDQKITCECQGNPLGNFSSEVPDRDRFLVIRHRNIPPVDRWHPPPGGGGPGPGDYGTVDWCWSDVSQEDAEDCWRRKTDIAILQDVIDSDPNPPPVTPTTLVFPHNQMYENTPQTCSHQCKGLNISTYTVPQGAVIAETQAAADAIAHSIACYRAQSTAHCGIVGPITYYNHEVSRQCSADAANADFVITIPAGTYTSRVSQEDVDILAEEAAEAILFEQCYWVNAEYTQECPEGTTGDPVTIPAGTYVSHDSQEDADELARLAAEATIECTPDAFDCGATPTSIGSTVWVHGSGAGSLTITGGSGPWSMSGNSSTHAEALSTICNPGEAYPITVTAPWSASGSVRPEHDHLIQLILSVGGVTSFDTRDLVSGPFTPLVVSGLIPRHQTVSLRVDITILLVSDTSAGASSTSNLTIT